MAIKLVRTTDPRIDPLGYGLWICPTCGARFFGGGPALHERGCADAPNEYQNLEYHFGANELATAISFANQYGENHRAPLGPLSVALLREQGLGQLVDSHPDYIKPTAVRDT